MWFAEFTRELIHGSDRFFHQPLRAGNLVFEALRVDRRLLFQRQQPDIDAQQGLGNLIVQLGADLLSFRLLCRQNLVSQMPQMFLQAAGLLQQPGVGSRAFFEGLLHGLALDDSLFQGPVGGRQVHRAPAQCLVQSAQTDTGLEGGAVSLFDRSDGLGKKISARSMIPSRLLDDSRAASALS